MDRPESSDLALQRGDVGVVDELVVDRGHRVLPQQLLVGHPRTEVADDRAHVAVQQLVPGPGERVGELVGVLEEPLRDLLVDRVGDQRDVGRRHHRRVALRRIVRVRHRVLGLGVLRASTAGRRPGCGSAPTRRRRGSRRSRCPTGSGCWSTHPRARWRSCRHPCRCRSCSSSRSPAARAVHPRARGRRTCRDRRRRGPCRTCGRRRSARRSPRRSSPCG